MTVAFVLKICFSFVFIIAAQCGKIKKRRLSLLPLKGNMVNHYPSSIVISSTAPGAVVLAGSDNVIHIITSARVIRRRKPIKRLKGNMVDGEQQAKKIAKIITTQATKEFNTDTVQGEQLASNNQQKGQQKGAVSNKQQHQGSPVEKPIQTMATKNHLSDKQTRPVVNSQTTDSTILPFVGPEGLLSRKEFIQNNIQEALQKIIDFKVSADNFKALQESLDKLDKEFKKGLEQVVAKKQRIQKRKEDKKKKKKSKLEAQDIQGGGQRLKNMQETNQETQQLRNEGRELIAELIDVEQGLEKLSAALEEKGNTVTDQFLRSLEERVRKMREVVDQETENNKDKNAKKHKLSKRINDYLKKITNK